MTYTYFQFEPPHYIMYIIWINLGRKKLIDIYTNLHLELYV